MRPASERLAALLAGPQVTYGCRAEAWYGGKLTAESVPVFTGRARFTAGPIETVEVTLSVPVDQYEPLTEPDHPLAAYGQRLRLFIDIVGPTGEVETTPLGWFRIESSLPAGDFIDIVARDLSVEIQRARLTTPRTVVFSSSTSAEDDYPISDAIILLLIGLIPVAFLDDLPIVGGSVYCDRDRYAKVQELLTTAGAWARVDASGAFTTRLAAGLEEQTPTLTLADGVSGTLTDLKPSANASAGFNACIVQGVAPNGAPVYGGAYLKDGPMAWPIGNATDSAYGTNPGFFFSPLLRKVADCRRTAESLMRRWNLGASGTFTASCAPDPRLETYDAIRVVKGSVDRTGLIQAIDLPLTATSGQMEISGVLL